MKDNRSILKESISALGSSKQHSILDNMRNKWF